MSVFSASGVSPDAVEYFRAGSHEVTAHYENGEEERMKTSIGNIEDVLGGCGFCRVHRSYLANLSSVVSYSRSSIMMEGGAVLPIGRSYLALFDRAMGDWALVTAGPAHQRKPTSNGMISREGQC